MDTTYLLLLVKQICGEISLSVSELCARAAGGAARGRAGGARRARKPRKWKKMGINTDIMEYILSTPPKKIYVLNTEELERFNFATEIVEPLK